MKKEKINLMVWDLFRTDHEAEKNANPIAELTRAQNPELVKRFTSREEALKELEKHTTEVYPDNFNRINRIIGYYVEGHTVDEDGEFLEGSSFDTAPLDIDSFVRISNNGILTDGVDFYIDIKGTDGASIPIKDTKYAPLLEGTEEEFQEGIQNIDEDEALWEELFDRFKENI